MQASVFEHIRLHPDSPQPRLIKRAAEAIRRGAIAAVPTESTYALMCLPTSIDAREAIIHLRNLDKKHLWSLVCNGLSQVAQYARMDNTNHRILKRHLPGPYTFILPAGMKIPRRIFGKRHDLGIRISGHPVCHALLETLGEPLLASSLQFKEQKIPAHNPLLFSDQLKHLNLTLLDAGDGGTTPTTVVDLCNTEPQLIRQGLGMWE